MAESIEPVLPQEVDLDVQLELAQSQIGAATKSIEARQKAMAEGRLSTPKLPTSIAPSLSSRTSRLTSQATGEETDHTGTTDSGLPALPPSIQKIVSPEMGAKLKNMIASGVSPRAPDERDKIIAIAKSFNRNPKFAQKVLGKLESGTFSDIQKYRVNVAGNLLEAARGAYGDDFGGLAPGALTQFLDQALLQESNIGANKEVRIDLNRNLQTGRLIIDVPNSLAKSLASHTRDLVREKGATYLRELDPEIRNEILKEAGDRASSDIVGIALGARNLTMFDPGDVDVKALAKEHFRGIKAHLTRYSTKGGIYEAFSPTVAELASEGPLDYFLRAQSPFDWMAPKMKLIREKLDAEGAADKYGSLAYLYAVAAYYPIANDWAMAQLGVTAEEEVRAYVDGWTWAEEGKVKHANLAALVADATGGDGEAVRKKDMASLGSLTLPMAAYLFEPDVIFFATMGLGKGLTVAKAAKAARPMVSAATLLRKMAKSGDVNLATVIHELEKIDKVMAQHAKITITAKNGKGIGDIDTAVGQLAKREEEAAAAEEVLRGSLGGKDIDDLVDVARLSRDNPELATQLADVLEKRARVLGKAESVRAGLNVQIRDTSRIIEAQRKAKTTFEETKKALDKRAAELTSAMNKSEGLRNFVPAESILIRFTGELKAAMAMGDQAKVVALSAKIARATKNVKHLRGFLSKDQKAFIKTFRKETKSLSAKFRKAHEAYHGNDVLKALVDSERKFRTTRLRFNPIVARAEEALTQATMRVVVADPKAAKKFIKALTESGVTTTRGVADVSPAVGWKSVPTGTKGLEANSGLGKLTIEESSAAMRETKTGVQLAEFIAKNADDPVHRRIAERIMPHLAGTNVHVLSGADDLPAFILEMERAGTLKPNMVNRLLGLTVHGSRLRIPYRGVNYNEAGKATSEVLLRGRPLYPGTTAEVALHELIHAATIRRLSDGNLLANKGTKLQKATGGIIDLHNKVVGIAKEAQKGKKLDSVLEEILISATRNQKEFVAYGLTNKAFQDYLMTIRIENKSAWNVFVEKIADILGVAKKDQNALTDLVRLTDDLLDAPLGKLSARPMTELIADMSKPIKTPATKKTRSAVSSSTAQILRDSQKLVGDFVKKERLLSDSIRANRWRQSALGLADDYDAAAKVVRKVGGQRGLIFAKTGVLGAKTDDAIQVFSGAVREMKMPKFSAGVAARGITETTEKGGRSVRITDSVEGLVSDAEIIARVSDEVPDLLRVQKVAETVDEPLRSQATIGNIQSLLHYAQRNGLGLDLSGKELGALRDHLRAAGMNLDSSGKMGVEALRGVELGAMNARLGELGPGVLLNGAGIYEKMVSGFGEAAAKFTLKQGGEAGKLMERAIGSGVPIRITLAQAIEVQFELGPILAKASNVLDPAKKHEKLAAILMDARAYHPTFKKTWLGNLGNYIEHTLRAYDPWHQKLGSASEDVARIVRGGENLTEVAWDEYSLILKEAGKGRDAVRQATFRYLDTTALTLLPGSKASVFNRGSKTIYQRAKKALLSDIAHHEYKVTKGEEAAAYFNNPAILGLSRIWLPPGVAVPEKIAGKLYGDTIKNLSKASTAQEFVELQRAATTRRLGEGFVPSVKDAEAFINKSVDPRIGRVYSFATRSFITGAAYEETATIAKRASMGIMSAEEAADINRIMTGDLANISDIDKAFDRMYAMGMTFMDPTTDIGKAGISAWGDANKHGREIVKFADDASGEAIFGLNIARRSLDQALGKFVKSLEATEAGIKDPNKKLLNRGMRKVTELWRTAAVSGLGIPNFGRPIFDYYGDWTQMIFSDKLGFANRALFQNVWAGIPKYGPMFQDRMSRLAKTTKQPQLRTFMETLFNPHIEDFWQGKQGALRMGKNGPLVSYDYLRRRSIVDGIWDTQTSTDVLNLAQKLVQEDPSFIKLQKAGGKLDFIFDGAKTWQASINRWVQTMQQRQRVGTYLIHLSEGKSFDEAARLTRNAIYDWKHGISEGEILYSLRMFPFVRWARLTSNQLTRGALEGLTRPDLNKFAKAATGQTAMNRLKVMYRVQTDLVPYMMDSRSPEQIAEEEGYKNAVARALYPSWQKSSGAMRAGVWTGDAEDLERGISHWSGVLPPNGLLDVLNMYGGGASMIAGTFLSMSGEKIAGADLRSKGFDHAIGMMYPAYRDWLEAAVGVRRQRGSGFGQPTPITQVEAEILRKLGISTSHNKEKDQFYTTEMAIQLLLQIPLVTFGVTRLENDWKFRNPAAGKDLADQMKYFALAQTRALRVYPFNVYKEHERLQKVMSERAKIVEKKYKFDKK